MVATRGQILWLKCIKFNFGSAPDPAGGVYSAPQTSTWFKEPISKRRAGKGRAGHGKGEGKKKGKGKGEGRGEGRSGRGALMSILSYTLFSPFRHLWWIPAGTLLLFTTIIIVIIIISENEYASISILSGRFSFQSYLEHEHRVSSIYRRPRTKTQHILAASLSPLRTPRLISFYFN